MTWWEHIPALQPDDDEQSWRATLDRLRDSIDTSALTRRQRQVLTCRYLYGWTQRQAADTLGISRASYRTHLDRAIARLQATVAQREQI